MTERGQQIGVDRALCLPSIDECHWLWQCFRFTRIYCQSQWHTHFQLTSDRAFEKWLEIVSRRLPFVAPPGGEGWERGRSQTQASTVYPHPSPALPIEGTELISRDGDGVLNHVEKRPFAERRGNFFRLFVLGVVVICCGVLAGCDARSTNSRQSAPIHKPLEKVTEKGPVTLTVQVSPSEPKLSDLVDMDVIVT
ncbi:MAG: hypothetical protein FJ267_05130, partial [Planctomycetes bacterium]|nr:hypothetical protein [Planctomycetota bacterium]